MTLLTEAVIFAARAHDGLVRRGSQIPYIVHPMEAAAIAAALGADEETVAAAALHDVVEDCGVTPEELTERFGARVAQLVESQTQTPTPDPAESWLERKREALEKLERGGRDVKLLALADKLSNMRAIRRDYKRHGEGLFSRFHAREKALHARYYRACARLIAPEFEESDEWRELNSLICQVFGEDDGGAAL